MIAVSLRPEKGAVILEGHAGSAPEGQDLVCAAVTALVCAYARYVQGLYDLGGLSKKPTICLAKGKAKIVAKAKEPFAPQWQGAYEMLSNGLATLSEAYPQYVEFCDE